MNVAINDQPLTFDQLEQWLYGDWNGSGTARKPRLANSRLRVLLAEDCPDTAMIITSILEEYKFAVYWVADGPSCIQHAIHARDEDDPYDLVLVDIRMPNIDGFGVVKHLRLNGYEGPVLAITANPSLAVRNQSISAGFDGFLAKSGIRQTIIPAIESITTPRQLS